MGSPSNGALKALLALSILVTPGCADLFPPPPSTEHAPPPPVAQDAAARPKTYGCANAGPLAPRRPAPVPLEALRRAADAADEATSDAILGQLGQLRVRERAGEPRVFENEYSDIGLRVDVMRADGKQIIQSVELLAGLQSTWAAPLPEGLSFAMHMRDTFEALGLSDEKQARPYAGAANYYRGRGLFVRFDSAGCLFSVGLVPRIAPGKIRFTNLAYRTDMPERGLTGIHIDVTRALGEFGDPNTPIQIGVDLRDEKGEPVRALNVHGQDGGPLRVEQADFARGEIRRVLFVPFVAMRLLPGRRALRAEISARTRGASGTSTPIEAETGGTLEISFEMPLLRRARLGVAHAEVDKTVYDKGAAGAHFAAPDLRWVFAREVQGIRQSYTSPTREDVFSASWSELTPWMVVTPDEMLTLCVEDEDVLSSETIGCVSLTLDDAIARAKEKKPLSGRSVRRLLLATPQVAPLPKR